MIESDSYFLTREQSRRIDELAIHQFGIPGVVLMENAGRNCAEWILNHQERGRVLILCGSGNNGGDGFVIARYLTIAGLTCEVLIMTEPANLKGDAAQHFQSIEAMKLIIHRYNENSPRFMVDTLKTADLVIDCLIGTGLDRPLSSTYRELINETNKSAESIISIDIPSGLDANSGLPYGASIKAKHTLTLVSKKTGFQNPYATFYTGEIAVITIGLPKSIFELL